MRIQITPEEYDARRLESDHLAQAVRVLTEDGYVILGGAVATTTLDAIKPKLSEDTLELLRRGRWGGAGNRPGHLQQAMPRSRRHIYADIVTNPLIIQVTAAVLGEGLHNHFYNGNTNLPGSEQQPLHRDFGHLWPDLIHPTTSIVINLSPVDVDEANGATELWPGTHHLPGPVLVSERDEQARRDVAPPVRATTQKGDAVLRDIRVWHRGVPNHGTEARHMIGMIHSRWFYVRGTTIAVTKDAEHAFDDEVLTTRVEIVPDDYDYLSEFIKP
jgi:hypothetical protein